MDATLQIIIRAQARQANAALAGTTKQLSLLQRAAQKMNLSKMTGFFDMVSGNKLVKAGKNLQWLGRQLLYNLTLPIGLAGVALFRFVQDVDRELTRLAKVYGTSEEDATELKKEVEALGKSFQLLSSYYGVHQAEVVQIGAAWAQAGSAGRGLAENTKTTMEVMVLGELDAVKATEALIAIQATWRFSTKKNADGTNDLTVAMAELNAIENATAIDYEGLIDVYQRAGGMARSTGVEFRYLGAMAAAIVPGAATSTQAGNSLKTIISRLVKPTQEATTALKYLGISLDDPKWMGMNVAQKLEVVAERFMQVDSSQRAQIATMIAGRWQVNRFLVLMEDMASGTGYYQRALDATADTTKVMETYQRELGAVLASNPKKWDILTNVVRNTMADAFIPLLPAIFAVLNGIVQLTNWFGNLDESTQKWIMFSLVAAALVGPILILIATFAEFLGILGTTTWFIIKNTTLAFWNLGKVILFLAVKGVPLLIHGFILLAQGAAIAAWVISKVLTVALWNLGVLIIRGLAAAVVGLAATLGIPIWAVVALIAAVVAAIILILDDDLRDNVWRIIQDIARGFAALPGALADALNAVIRVIGQAVGLIAEGLSYLNPFARHSPSLVDSVRAGVSTILDEYSRLTKITPLISNAINALNDFGMANAGLRAGRRETELREQANVSGVVGGDQIVNAILALESEIPNLTSEIAAQRIVVARWNAEFKLSEGILDRLEAKLSETESALDKVTSQIEAARDRISELASAPIAGLTAMEDQIFENEMAQKRLNLELLKFEQAGYTIDQIQDKYAALNGEIELLRGEQASLRSAGAGSDVLSVYEDQIAAIEAQREEMGGVEQQIVDIQKQLDSLDLERRFLELTKAINFDPLERQIQKISMDLVEMPFDEIVAKIQEQKGIIASLTPIQENLIAQVDRERTAVDMAAQAHEGVKTQLDVEQTKLEELETAYNDINDLIREMENLLSSVSGDAAAIIADADKAKDALDGLGEGVDIPIEGGGPILGREGGLAEIEDFNDELQQMLDDMLKGMNLDDIWKPFKDAWDRVKVEWEKIKGWFGTIFQWIKDYWWYGIALIAGGLITVAATAIYLGWKEWGDDITAAFDEYVLQPMARAADWFWGRIQWVWDQIVGGFSNLWAKMQAIWDEFGAPLITTIGSVFSGLWGLINMVWDGIVGAHQEAWSIISGIFSTIWDQIANFLIPIVQMWLLTNEIAWTLVWKVLQFAWKIIKVVFDSISWGIGKLIDVHIWFAEKHKWVFDQIASGIHWFWDHSGGWLFSKWDWAMSNTVETFTSFKDRIVHIWSVLGTVLQNIWDDKIAPIWETFQAIFDQKVKPAFRSLYENIIKPIMSAIVGVFSSSWNAIAMVLETGINFFVAAFNTIADVINTIAGWLGIENRIKDMEPISIPRFGSATDFSAWDALVGNAMNATPASTGGGGGTSKYLASGGVVGAEGDVVTGARAIVGEGSNIWPEYVIPTDPRYRGNARGLYTELGHTLWNGGIWGDLKGVAKGAYNTAKSGLDAVGGAIKEGAIKLLWDPVKWAAQRTINQIPVDFIRSAGSSVLGAVDSWITGADSAWEEAAMLRRKPIDGPGSWGALVTYLARLGVPFKILSTFRPGALTRYGRSISWHAKNRAIDFSGPEGMVNYIPSHLLAINKALYQGFKPYFKELIYGGPGAQNVYYGRDHKFSDNLMREHINHVHAALAKGGFVVPRTPGGSLFRIGEGLYDEKVQVLPLRGDEGQGDTYNIYGDLSFPNITNPNDAYEFIENLKAMI